MVQRNDVSDAPLREEGVHFSHGRAHVDDPETRDRTPDEVVDHQRMDDRQTLREVVPVPELRPRCQHQYRSHLEEERRQEQPHQDFPSTGRFPAESRIRRSSSSRARASSSRATLPRSSSKKDSSGSGSAGSGFGGAAISSSTAAGSMALDSSTIASSSAAGVAKIGSGVATSSTSAGASTSSTTRGASTSSTSAGGST